MDAGVQPYDGLGGDALSGGFPGVSGAELLTGPARRQRGFARRPPIPSGAVASGDGMAELGKGRLSENGWRARHDARSEQSAGPQGLDSLRPLGDKTRPCPAPRHQGQGRT
jgi:hypothetical protein